MKLLQKTSRVYLPMTAGILLLAGVLLYFLVAGFIDEELIEKSEVNLDRMENQLKKGIIPVSVPPIMEIRELEGNVEEKSWSKDTLLYDPVEAEDEPFHESGKWVKVGDKSYAILVRQVMPETHDYLGSIGIALGIVMVLLIIALTVMNRMISRTIWGPFFSNMQLVKNWSFDHPEPLSLQPTEIEEFQSLNRTLEQMAERLSAEYRALREFTENASHEMQTPVSIAHIRLEELMQDVDLSQKQAEITGKALDALNRLARLNQALLLLAKIENRQFPEVKSVDLGAKMHSIAASLQEIFADKNLQWSWEEKATPAIQANPALIEILLGNLLRNACIHNIQDGTIDISLDAERLRIRNTGKPLSGSPEVLFERFRKADAAGSSHGLGLAIVQKICATYGWKVQYFSENNLHIIEISW